MTLLGQIMPMTLTSIHFATSAPPPVPTGPDGKVFTDPETGGLFTDPETGGTFTDSE